MPDSMQPIMPPPASTGIPGLDFILRGGLPRGKAYLLQGGPGTGKTTLALQFLLAGVAAGERTFFITLSQSEADLQLVAGSHGWSLAGVDVYEVSRRTLLERLSARQTVIHPADVELGQIVDNVRDAIKERRPDRIVFDSIGVIRSLAGNLKNRYLEELALLLETVHEQGATALFLDEVPAQGSEVAFQTLAHGCLELSMERRIYGADQRWIYVRKMRGLDYLTGQHNYAIRRGGLEVFPRLQKPDGGAETTTIVNSGIDSLDRMLGGGMQSGTSCLLVGAAGTGKSSVATAYGHAALRRGDKAAFFLFEERPETFLMRSRDLGMDLRPFVENGQLQLQSIDTGELTPGEFAQALRKAVDNEGVSVIAIDSLTGYFMAMGEQKMLISQMHEMLDYLSQRNVLSLLIVAQHGLVGSVGRAAFDISYMADTVLLLRNFEAVGRVRRAITVVTKRYGDHEQSIRELKISGTGITIGDPIEGFIDVLSGQPRFVQGAEAPGTAGGIATGGDDDGE